MYAWHCTEQNNVHSVRIYIVARYHELFLSCFQQSRLSEHLVTVKSLPTSVHMAMKLEFAV